MRLAVYRDQERGDTIIEVVFAFIIFSMVAIGSLAIMNQGIATGERALEVDLVRNEVNAQAEALRFIHEARVASPTSSSAATWSRLVSSNGEGLAQEGASPYAELTADGDCKLPGDSYRPFIVNARTAQIWDGELEVEGTLPPYSQVVYNEASPTVIDAAYGIWVESVPSSVPLVKRFVDFHIRACWPSPGSAKPMTIGTIVRLYDPS